MISGFIVKKISSTKLFDDQGKLIVGTICQAPELIVTQVKTTDKDSYQAIQFAYGSSKSVKKPVAEKLKKIKINSIPRGFVEFKAIKETKLSIGDILTIDQVLELNEKVNVIGKTRGRGFSGVIKRHGFHRQPVTRGQSDRTRAPGSIGAQTPGKVVKGKSMPGHFGNEQVTIKNLRILDIDKDKKQVIISGAIPGHRNSWLLIKRN